MRILYKKFIITQEIITSDIHILFENIILKQLLQCSNVLSCQIGLYHFEEFMINSLVAQF